MVERALLGSVPVSSTPAAPHEPRSGPREVTVFHGLAEAERAELERLERKGIVLRKGNGGFQGVYSQGARFKSGVSLGQRGKYLWLGMFDTAEEAALARGRWLADKVRQERKATLEQERVQQIFLRPEIGTHPAYQLWMDEQIDEFSPKGPCPFQYGVDYDIDPVTLEVIRVSDGKVIVQGGAFFASGDIIQTGEDPNFSALAPAGEPPRT